MNDLPKSPVRRGRLFSFLVLFMLLAGQVALGIHQFEHHAALSSDKCCAFASSVTPASAPDAILSPGLVGFFDFGPTEQQLPSIERAVAGFLSRAPPLTTSA